MSSTITLPYAGSVLPSIVGGPAAAGTPCAAALDAAAAWLAGAARRARHAAKQIDTNDQGRPRGPEPV